MADEHVYSVRGSKATPAEPITLADAGLRERDDLQEWVLARPEILGEGVKIISFEFDRWESSRGERQLNRLDVLGLDTNGRLVLAELKRDRAADTVHMQAISYAALVSRFEPEDVLGNYLQHRRRTEPQLTEDEANEELLDHAGELDLETLRQPRIVLVAGSFSPVTTATVVWLVSSGINITLQRVQAYRTAGGELVVTVSQLFPIREVEDFLVAPMRAEARAVRERVSGRRERPTVLRLIDMSALADGTPLTLVPTNDLSADLRTQVLGWITEDPTRGQATWVNDAAKPLIWTHDGQAYRPTTIVKTIISEATGVERQVAGPSWWQTEDGRTLPEVAGFTDAAAFDWSVLHALLEQVPTGRWASYGDIAKVIGTAAQPLGRHIATCHTCANPHRVLDSKGTSSDQFAWTDPKRTDTQQDALEAEGVVFADGRASSAHRMSEANLRALIADLE